MAEQWDGVDRRASVDKHIVELKDELRNDFDHLENKIEEIRDEFRSELERHEREEHLQFSAFNTRLMQHIESTRKYEEVIDEILSERKAKAEFWRSVSSSLVSQGIWAGILGITALAWYWIEHQLKK